MNINKKQITFDLSQEKLKYFYPRRNSQSDDFYKRAYSDIQKFMLKNGFSHRQYSVYVSEEKMTYNDVNVLTKKLIYKMPWIKNCVNEIDVSSVGMQFSLKDRINQFYDELNEKVFLNEQEWEFDEGYEYDEEEPEL